VKKLIGINRDADAHWVGNGFPVRTIFSYQAKRSTLSAAAPRRGESPNSRRYSRPKGHRVPRQAHEVGSLHHRGDVTAPFGRR
jgi:hypothetical protein